MQLHSHELVETLLAVYWSMVVVHGYLHRDEGVGILESPVLQYEETLLACCT